MEACHAVSRVTVPVKFDPGLCSKVPAGWNLRQ